MQMKFNTQEIFTPFHIFQMHTNSDSENFRSANGEMKINTRKWKSYRFHEHEKSIVVFVALRTVLSVFVVHSGLDVQY